MTGTCRVDFQTAQRVDQPVPPQIIRGTGSPHNLWLRDAIRAETPLGWTDPVLYELTAGARSARMAALR